MAAVRTGLPPGRVGAGAGADSVSEIIKVINKQEARTMNAEIFILKVSSGSKITNETG